MVRSWIRQALRASGVAILVPAAVAAAIALSVVGGGGGIGSLDDVLNGPAVPPAEAAAAPAGRPHRDERPRPRTRTTAVVARAAQPRRAPARGGRPHSVVRPVTTPPEGSRPGHAGGPPSPAQPPPAAPSPGAPPAPPPAQPHPVHDTGTQVAEAVRPLPVAGPVAAGAVQAVVDLVDPSI